ncbi:hypothetical protein BDF19DRAFT_423013 [Syncephalis fuscata]|nr:hypothetical protein BDF19DRAFT_423013 [Syncephalis fuscata]
MRLPWILLLALLACTWTSVVSAWEQLDYDIFDLVDDIQTATTSEIVKAHRRLSLAVHPDKNPSKEAEKTFKQLGAITAILKDSEKRDRYGFFLKNGVPTWRGTGYYYKRHRPGLSGVLIMLTIFGSAVHYLLLYVGWWRGNDRWRTLQADLKKRKGRASSGGTGAVQGYIVTEEGDWPVKKPTLASVFAIAIPLWFVRRLVMPNRREDDGDGEATLAEHTSDEEVAGNDHGSDNNNSGRNTPTPSQRTLRPRRRKANK